MPCCAGKPSAVYLQIYFIFEEKAPASVGAFYFSHAATIYKWAQEDAAKGKAAPKQGIPDYSCKEGESL